MAAKALSNLHYTLAPNFYGSQQEDYLHQSSRIIEDGVKMIVKGRDSGEDLTKLFYVILRFFQNQRKELAIRHSTINAELFGAPRQAKENFKGSLSLTGLYGQYISYNEVIIAKLASKLLKLPHDLRGFSQKTVVEEETCLGRKFKFSIEVKDHQDVSAIQKSIPTHHQICSALGGDFSLDEINNNYDLQKKLKEKLPDAYRNINFIRTITAMNAPFPSPKIIDFDQRICDGDSNHLKNIFLIGTLRAEIGGQLVALSRYVSWLYTNYREDPVQRMERCSKVFVWHQDPFLNERTLAEIATLFKKAVQWDKKTESLSVLKNQVALIRWLFAHCMPSARGDGAIGDWLELSLYYTHGLRGTKYSQEKMPNIEPIVSFQLSDYLNKYDQIIDVSDQRETV